MAPAERSAGFEHLPQSLRRGEFTVASFAKVCKTWQAEEILQKSFNQKHADRGFLASPMPESPSRTMSDRLAVERPAVGATTLQRPQLLGAQCDSTFSL